MGQDDRHYLRGNHERMLNHTPIEFDAIPTPYFDPCLKRNRRAYLKFCKQLMKLGLVEVTDKVLAEVGLFFLFPRNTGPFGAKFRKG